MRHLVRTAGPPDRGAGSAGVQGELLDDRIREQVPGQLGDRGQRRLVRGPVPFDLEPLPLPSPHDPTETQPVARAGNGLPLGVVNLRFEHDVHDHSGHVPSWTIRAYIVC